MRWMLAIGLVLAAGCGKGKSAPKVVPANVTIAPVVTAAGVVATLKRPPPLVVMIAGEDRYTLATTASWEKLAKRELVKGPVKVHPTNIDTVYAKAYETHVLQASLDENLRYAGEESVLDLAVLDDPCRDRAERDQDDPPPPKEEDRPDDGEEESGGTGTAMALDEGKLGKRDSDRAEGQYKMRKSEDEPPEIPLTPERIASGFPGIGPATFRCLDNLEPGKRRAQAVGDAGTRANDGNPSAIILVEPKLPARLIIDGIERSRGGAIGVTLNGEIRPLGLRFDEIPGAPEMRPASWIELRVLDNGFELGGPRLSAARPFEKLTELAAHLSEVRSADKLDPNVAIDVLIAESIDAQHLVDVLAALIDAKVAAVGLGRIPKPR